MPASSLIKTPALHKLVSGRSLLRNREAQRSFDGSLETLAGRVVELCGGPAEARLSLAVRLLLQAQSRPEPAAWIGQQAGTFFPPDLAAAGLDLEALPVVMARQETEAWTAAERLLRSGAFTLLVLDPAPHWDPPMALLSLLARHAREHHSTLLCLSGTRSLPGSLVSLRLRTWATRQGFDCFELRTETLRDRSCLTREELRESCHGPDGLC